MKIEQIYTGCLAQGAYYIESNGEAAIIDPLREVQPYIDMAAKNNAKIKYVFETHFHADFVSGHLTLAEKTGASIVYGPSAETKFESITATDNQVFKIGDIQIKTLHTPGHTMESTCYLLIDENGKENALFSGDTLFLGDVGRPDLAQKAAHMTQEGLAGLLYDSLRNKVMNLPSNILVYPAHGAGSACGKNMSTDTVDTLANQLKTNYALRADMTKEEFVKEVTDGLLPPPAYFPHNVRLNKEGYKSIDDVIIKGEKALSPDEFENLANQSEALILDVRNDDEFAEKHIPRSIFIGLNGSFAPWVGALIKDTNQPILLVVPEEKLEEAITRLSRVGFDNILGYLKGGISAWASAGKDTDSITRISPEEFAKRYKNGNTPVYDVRKPGEWQSEHVVNSVNTPLDNINDFLKDFPTDKDFYTHCAGGYRSIIAGSILKSRGIHNIVDVRKGFGQIKLTDIDKTAYVCPSTLV
jgi:glyoxylase-like metal-dependent hydrolase (beta-lactamase superfamily II)/rhodanese-related sulfurtransferase